MKEVIPEELFIKPTFISSESCICFVLFSIPHIQFQDLFFDRKKMWSKAKHRGVWQRVPGLWQKESLKVD